LPYLLTAAALNEWVEEGAPWWASFILGLCLWNALKFIAAGPMCLLQLARVRFVEWWRRRRAWARALTAYEAAGSASPRSGQSDAKILTGGSPNLLVGHLLD